MLHAYRLTHQIILRLTQADSETACVAAIKELLDRGYGKATQPIAGFLSADIDSTRAGVIRVPVLKRPESSGGVI